MSDLAFQYIGFGCVFLAALRIMDVGVHVLLGIALAQFNLSRYYYLAVDTMDYQRKDYQVTYTGTDDGKN